uniref:CHK domain-containing protein n=1 Tax=Glossina brevipalpis TaxID=37001 RepID=A0A1A9WWV3_9MUSC
MGLFETSQMAVSSHLNLEFFRDIFQSVEPDILIDTYEEEPGSGRGDNYTATLYRIHLNGQRRLIDNKTQRWEKSLICKRLPENIHLREAYKSDKLFRNEVEFYMTIMPELLQFQVTKTTEVFKAIPECYYARSDLLIMEDLRVRGFQMPDRKQGLTLNETQLVLQKVAHFHALSLSYKFEKPAQFENFRKLTTEGLFCKDNETWYKNYYDKLLESAIEMVSDVLAENSKYLKALKGFAESSTFFSNMVDMVNEDTNLTALCHGDCWANNFLYRYELDADGQKQLMEVCLVDFQLIRYGSIALDVTNLLFCCTSKTMRDQHLEELIQLYTDEIYRWLKILCNNIPEYCNRREKFQELFRQELKAFGRFALGLSLDIIPISTCSSEDAPDMFENKRCEGLESKIGAPELNFPPNELCRQKMSEILIDLVDNGML